MMEWVSNRKIFAFVACRDFPHPRHLCVKFPFKNTPHEKYCEKCHCYVCDKPAPCLFWGKENPDKDHCHSSDKEEKWKRQRTFYKMRDCKEPPRTLQRSFNTILTLTATRTTVPVSRSNQANAGAVSPLQLNPNMDQQRSLYPTTIRNCAANKEVTPSRYTKHVANQNPRVGRSRSRFTSPYRRDPLNLGSIGHGGYVRGSNGSRFSADDLQRQRNCFNTFVTNNNRPNPLDACSITQTQSINIHSSEQIHANDMLQRNVSCPQTSVLDDMSKLWDFLLGADIEESGTIQNDSSSDLSLNITLNPSSSSNSNATNVTMQPNPSTESLASCVDSNHELQLLPQSSFSVGVSTAAENIVQWPHTQNPSSTATEQSAEPASYFNYDWLHETAYPPLNPVIDPWPQFVSEVTSTGHTWNYVASQPSTKINESGVSVNISDQNPIKHNNAETGILAAQPQQAEWAIPQVPYPDISNTAGQICSDHSFATSSSSAPALYVDLNNSWETLAMRQNPSSYFECT
ncbi:uncharacterized protein LOC131051331 isoform X2 [Cryptomeria japonica]|uniref:uncharacterized protein LOC131051331 isoform X2 n=1 Tax=Cryptomeria japonica TaxID=3369 RepID=UPI0027DA19B9|nr:uncharacterized protein LOC131051331 isoform X2 [Cryptomeria japonica]XP_057841777.2 uncharacterized protein LOC131051331 isoform X2 [Cryptomeria japonica]